MSDQEGNARPEGVSTDGRPRRQPPIIDVKAVEVSLDGSGAAKRDGLGSGAGRSRWASSATRILAFLPPLRIGIIGSACIMAGIIAGTLWIYLAPDGTDGPQRTAASPEAAVPDDVNERIGRLESIVRAPPPKDLANRVAALDATLASLSDRIAALERGIHDAVAAANVAGQRADKAAGLVEEAKKNGDAQNSAQQQLRALEDLASRVKTFEALQAALQQKQEALDRLANALTTPDKTIRVAILATALRNAVERNRSFAVELAAARSLGLDDRALASLEPFAATGLPTRNELFRELSALLPELRRASVPPGRDFGYLDRLQASAVKMLNIRPVRDEPGDDAATVMSRIEFKIIQRDVEAVVAEMDKLPAPARELAQPWRTKALARQDAIESARLIAAASMAKLGEPAVSGPSSP
jgi:hypothetical protein